MMPDTMTDIGPALTEWIGEHQGRYGADWVPWDRIVPSLEPRVLPRLAVLDADQEEVYRLTDWYLDEATGGPVNTPTVTPPLGAHFNDTVRPFWLPDLAELRLRAQRLTVAKRWADDLVRVAHFTQYGLEWAAGLWLHDGAFLRVSTHPPSAQDSLDGESSRDDLDNVAAFYRTIMSDYVVFTSRSDLDAAVTEMRSDFTATDCTTSSLLATFAEHWGRWDGMPSLDQFNLTYLLTH